MKSSQYVRNLEKYPEISERLLEKYMSWVHPDSYREEREQKGQH
jgi:hypothetical protein